jgi:hypothetical protein
MINAQRNLEERSMKRSIILAALVSAFALGSLTVPASAQTAAACEAKAMSKTGKPLSGAAKTASVRNCMKTYCEANAVGNNGKKLSGAARTSFLKKCEAG